MLTDSKGGKATITQADQQFTNGVVHEIDAVLMPARLRTDRRLGRRPASKRRPTGSHRHHHPTSARGTARYK